MDYSNGDGEPYHSVSRFYCLTIRIFPGRTGLRMVVTIPINLRQEMLINLKNSYN